MLVEITFTQEMKFQKQVEIDDEEFYSLRDLNNEDFNNRVNAYHIIQGYVTPHDIYDSIDEIKDFYIKPVDSGAEQK